MKPIVVVSGLMRSGTSWLARTLHDEGLPMGSLMFMPMPGTEPEYEDAALSRLCLESVVSGESPPTGTFSRYIEVRGQERWGVKTPLLLPFLRQWKRAVGKRGMKLILTERPLAETLESIDRRFAARSELPQVHEIQKRLWKAYPRAREVADLVVPTKQIAEEPDAARRAVLSVLEE